MQRKYRPTDELLEETEQQNCSICRAPTRYTHLTIDTCRTCAVFYRRLIKSGRTVCCRTGEGQCDLTTRGNMGCKKCRYDRIVALLNANPRIQQQDSLDKSTPSTSSPISIDSAPTVSSAAIGMLTSVRRGHSAMNAIRRARELSARTAIPKKPTFVVDGMILVPTTSKLFNQTTRILISSIFEFASTSFDEFDTLGHEEKWLLIRNFYPLISVLDMEYRMNKFLPEEETMTFTSYASYIDHDTVEMFFADTPNDNNRKDNIRFMTDQLEEGRKMRSKMRRWNPSEDEYIAFLGICFWSLDKINVNDKLQGIAEKYRQLLFLDLDQLYRNTMRIEEYASRMGEATLFIASIRGHVTEMYSKIGALKLMDDMWEEMILAQLLQ